MGITFKPLHEEQGSLLVRLDRRLEIQERSPTGAKTLGPQYLAVIPAARAQLNTLTALGPSGTISFDVEARDTAAIWDAGSPTRLTAPIAGLYLHETCIFWGANAAGSRTMTILRNAAGIIAQSKLQGDSVAPIFTTVKLAAGDYIETTWIQTSGANLTSTAYGAMTWLGNV